MWSLSHRLVKYCEGANQARWFSITDCSIQYFYKWAQCTPQWNPSKNKLKAHVGLQQNDQCGTRLRQFIDETDLDNVAEFFKQAIFSQQIAVPDNSEANIEEKNVECEMIEGLGKEEISRLESHRLKGSVNQEQRQQMVQEEEKDTMENGIEVQPHNNVQIQANHNNIKNNVDNLGDNITYAGLQFHKKKLSLQCQKYNLYEQNAVKISSDVEKIQKLPLYGIDHSKQFFEAHPILSERFKVQQALARYYCNNGIDPNHYTEGLELNQEVKVTGPELQEITLIVMITTFRKIEQFIEAVCKKKITRIQNQDVRILYPILLNAKATLGETHLQTLSRMIRLAFDLPSKATPKEVLALYALLLDVIKSKKQQNELDFDLGEQIQQNFLWDEEKERKLCELYIEKGSMQGTLQPFNKFFGCSANICLLRLKLQSLIRRILKRLECELLRYDKEKQYSIYINQKKYRILAKDSKGLGLRQLLIRIYLKGEIYLQDLRNVCRQLQKVLFSKQKNETMIGKRDGPSNTAIKRIRNNKTSEEQSSKEQEPDSQKESSEEYYDATRKSLRRSSNDSSHSKRQLTLQETYQRSSVRHNQLKKLKGNSSGQQPNKKIGIKSEQMSRKFGVKQQFSPRYK